MRKLFSPAGPVSKGIQGLARIKMHLDGELTRCNYKVVDMTGDTALNLAYFYPHDNVIKILADIPISTLLPTDDDLYDSD